MKKIMIAAALAALALNAGPLWAQPAKPGPDSPPARASQNKDNVAEFDKQMSAAEANMRKMQDQMDALRKTQDPDARQRLLQEHWETMQGTMRLMQSIRGAEEGGCCLYGPRRGGPMMGNGPGSGPGNGPGSGMRNGGPENRGNMRRFYSGMTDRQLKEHQYMMDQYMGMQQSLMQQFMWHQMMQGGRAGAPAAGN